MIFAVLLVVTLYTIFDSGTSRSCALYLAPSTIPGAGRGIIAGKSFADYEVIDTVLALAISNTVIDPCQLINYVYEYDENYSSLALGSGLLYNHMIPNNVKHYWQDDGHKFIEPSEFYFPFTSLNYIEYRANKPIQLGQELFSNYGHDWFDSRQIVEEDVLKESKDSSAVNQNAEALILPLEQLERYGHCLSDVYVNVSDIHFAGKGLFAKRSFKQGEIVVISPVLTLPKKYVYATEDSSVFANYCMAVSNSEVVLFPVNNGAVMNHQPTGEANVAFNWYDWSSIPSEGSYFEHIQGNTLSLSDKLRMTPDELFAAPFSQLDIAFSAVRDIDEGEELTYDYGDGWTIEWNYYIEDLKAWEAEQLASGEVTVDGSEENLELDFSTMPRFRSYIGVPLGMYPSHWLHQK